MPSPFISVICFWSFFYTWFGFLYSQASSGNCETMESWTICNFDPKVPLVKFIFKNKGWSTGLGSLTPSTTLRIKINNKMEILLPIEGGGKGNKGTAVKQVSIVHYLSYTQTLELLLHWFLKLTNDTIEARLGYKTMEFVLLKNIARNWSKRDEIIES